MVFAKIFPEGSDAEQALHLVYRDQISDYHRQLIRVKLKSGKSADASDSDSGSDRSKDQETEMLYGHYQLSLHPLPRQIAHGWRLGRGYSRTKEEDRAVDILLIGPSHRTKGIAAVHALVQYHPRSGVLMIVGVLDEKPDEYETTGSKLPLTLGHGEKHVLYLPRNRIKLGNLYYNFVFEAFDNHEEYARYQTDRDLLFNSLGYEKPHKALSAIPRYQDAKNGPVVLHGTMSQGASGWVYAAVNARNGEPLAVKEHRPKNKEAARNVMMELEIGSRFANDAGVLPTIMTWCEHKFDGICGISPQSIFAATPLGLCDFSQFNWSKISVEQVVNLFRGPLQGLAALHRAGFMHRDIHRRNLLVMSVEPPRAVVHDFGISIQADFHQYRHLGPIATRAPEVDGLKYYTRAIDIWSLAFACCYSILPEDQDKTVRKETLNHTESINMQWHSSMKTLLSSYAKKGSAEGLLADLLGKMLQWNPADRISAADALQHRSMHETKPALVQHNDGQDFADWDGSLASSECTSSHSAYGTEMLAFHKSRQEMYTNRQTNSLLPRQWLRN
ncbi:MAG: hypothetical protein Q9173_001794 [Seirophora scorigena]